MAVPRVVAFYVVAACLALGASEDGAEQWPPAPLLETVASDADGAVAQPAPSVQVSANGKLWRCRFEFRPQGEVQSAALAGGFNEWNRATHSMVRQADGAWSVTLDLPSGKHLYKYVLDSDRWIVDPRNPTTEPDGHDGHNSVLMLGRLVHMRASSATVGDGRIDSDGIEHVPASMMYFQPLPPDRALVRLRTLAHDIESAALHLKNGAATPLRRVSEGLLLGYWEATMELPSGATNAAEQSLEYAFVVSDGQTKRMPAPPVKHAFAVRDTFVSPAWARDAVWYQIMLDRFRNGDPGNDPQPRHPWTSDWFKMQPWEKQGGEEFYKRAVFDRMYGGDLAGLLEKLPYLKELGVNAIYLNPVFEADGHHKYNATNYVHIDDDFGTRGDYAAAAAQENLGDPATWTWTETDKLFLKVIEACHAAGLRVVIDGVFNHVGTKHPAFADVKKNGKASPYADWFEVKSWAPFEYVGWAGHDALPVFRKSHDGLASAAVKKHIFDVTRRWMDPNGDGDPRDGIDGWRLDVPNEIAPPFWAEWRTLVKSINREAYITGEIWDRAEQWLDGRHFDAVMNYQFAEAVIYWALYERTKLKVSDMEHRLAELRLAYPRAATYVMQNLFNSHDTDRLASMALNPDRLYDRENRIQDNGPRYDNAKPSAEHYQKARLAALVQMTYVGAPMIYYGDEVGMWGADDPTCRKPMLWEDLHPYEKPEENHVMREHLDYYRQLIALRNAHPALRRGEFQTLLVDDAADVWVFARFDEKEKLIVAVNGSASPRDVVVKLPEGWQGRWSYVFGAEGGADGGKREVALRLDAVSGSVLKSGS